jgi:hypothetical protein
MREIKYVVISLLTLLAVSSVEASRDQDPKPLSPQEQSRFVISSKAGRVNFVEGELSLKRGDGEWKSLVATDEIQAADLVRTSQQARAEILLYPGAFLRLSGETQVSFLDTSLAHLKIRIAAGTAIIEAPAVDKFKGALATVLTPQGELSIIRAGVYKFDVDLNGQTTCEVFKGRLSGGSTELKEGQKASMNAGTASVSAFDAKTLDSFDQWSKDRSKALAQVSAALRNTTLPTVGSSLLGSNDCGGFWYFYGPIGSPAVFTSGLTGLYTYVPFGFCDSWFSPYGWEYLPWTSTPSAGPPIGRHHHKHKKPHGTDNHGTTLAAKPKAVAPGTVDAKVATRIVEARPGKIVVTDKPIQTKSQMGSPPQSPTPAARGFTAAPPSARAANRSSPN